MTPRTFVYACDDNYAALTAISAVSLLRHNPGARICVLGYGLKPASVQLIQDRIERQDGDFRILDATTRIAALAKEGCTSYVSYAVYTRIFIPELLPDEDSRILYLDSDTLVADDLSPLFERDLHGHPLALAPDVVHPKYKNVIGLPDACTYYNTGVLLMDLATWRTCNCTARLLEELAHPHGLNPLGDQDIIVRTLNSEIEPLEPRWNFLSQYFLLRRPIDAAVYHFSGHTLGRPWYTSSRHPLREAYRQAAADAELAEFAEQVRPMSPEYRLQAFLFKLLPHWAFTPISNLLYRTHIRLTYGV